MHDGVGTAQGLAALAALVAAAAAVVVTLPVRVEVQGVRGEEVAGAA